MPTGVSLQSGGSLSGTASATGTYSFTAEVTDSSSPAQTATQTYSVVISGSVAGTAVTSCQTLGNAGITYVLQNSVSSSGTCFTVSANNVTLNLNGFTITYGTGGSGNGIDVTPENNQGFTAYNGTITQGSSSAASPIEMGITMSGPTIYEITMTWSSGFTHGIDLNYSGNSVTSGANIHNNTFNNNSSATCTEVSCRDELQGTSLYISQGQYSNSGVHSIYNNTFTGGPQGAVACDAPGCLIYGNTLNAGNATEGYANDFLIYCWSSCNAYSNTGLANFNSPMESRGVQISGVECEAQNRPNCPGRNVHGNTIQAIVHANDSEYGGCELGGAYGIQWDDTPANSIATGNTFTARSQDCQAQALRVTDSETTTNVSSGNTYIAQHSTSAGACSPIADNGGTTCAYGMGFDMGGSNPGAFSSKGDSFQADDAEIFIDDYAVTNTVIVSPTFLKGTFNPQSDCSGAFCFIIARNLGNPATLYIQDATFGTGVNPDNNEIPAPGGSYQAVSVYLTWTQTVTVTKSGGGAASGATVTYTDALGTNYSASTNSSGVASVVVTQKRYNNDSAANGIENHNPFSLSVSLSGCTTNTTSGISISGTGSTSVTLGGC